MKERSVDMNPSAMLIIVSAPSGSGKTTIVEKLLDEIEGLKRSVSCTTRAPRKGEKDGRDYIFMSREDFCSKADKGEFLEWEENFGNLYGTSKEQVARALKEGKDIILSIDVKGAKKVKEDFPGSISFFILPPSPEVLAERLKGRRSDAPEQVALRLREAKREMEAAEDYDYLIINDDLGKAVKEIRTILLSERESNKGKR